MNVCGINTSYCGILTFKNYKSYAELKLKICFLKHIQSTVTAETKLKMPIRRLSVTAAGKAVCLNIKGAQSVELVCSINQGNSLSSSAAGPLGQLSNSHSVTHKCTISHNKTTRTSLTVQSASSESQGDFISFLS